jgi:transcriptional regulator with XRE-family HTH domain
MAVMPSRSEQDIQKRFGERVRELRKHKGLSQEELAFACGLDRTYVGSVERGERNISLVNIHVLASALRVPVKVLFDA